MNTRSPRKSARHQAQPVKARPSLGSYKVQQRRVGYGGRVFHFVSYENQSPTAASVQSASPGTWFLMSAGNRLEVMPQLEGEETAELDRRLLDWLQRTIK